MFFIVLECDVGWTLFEKYCYSFESSTKTRNLAESDCTGKNAHLASIHSKQENDFIRKVTNNEGVWIGGKRTGSSFQWLDGTPFDYKNWMGGEPNNYGGREYCLFFNWNRNNLGQWNDYHCEPTFPYVCKKGSFFQTIENISDLLCIFLEY